MWTCSVYLILLVALCTRLAFFLVRRVHIHRSRPPVSQAATQSSLCATLRLILRLASVVAQDGAPYEGASRLACYVTEGWHDSERIDELRGKRASSQASRLPPSK
ncbi:uncharacterized protein IWZ02DRAFT_156125 [Phyllosticta citriasiana]|uniref:uncharacterized protein n=1 Tax=Phyllosticta citriasiana TaxID=595635 RepID=UPI0030FDA743